RFRCCIRSPFSCEPGVPRANVLSRAIQRELHGSGAAPDEEVAVWYHFDSLPLQEDGLGAPLGAHDAHGLALHDLCLRVDAGTGPVTKAIAHDLCEVP